MENFDIYKDIATRTGGDIYIGVVGPVRTGKSTLVKKLTDKLILPNIANKNKQKVALDETPQSAGGKAVMTTEPKFVPSEAVSVKIDKTYAKIRLIDCVGYMTDGAFFKDEDGNLRLVKTPWSDEEMPFDKAAELGTEKVIKEHSTIAFCVTSDGSFTDIPRSAYAATEERVINELKSADKPFIVIFNVKDPSSPNARKEAREIEKKYGVTTISLNVENLTDEDVETLLSNILSEFPITSFDVALPKWMQALDADNFVVKDVMKKVLDAAKDVKKMKDVAFIEKVFAESEDFEDGVTVEMNAEFGSAKITPTGRSGLFYKVLSESCGEEMTDEFSIMNYVGELKTAKREYERLKAALDGVEEDGYGVTLPITDEMQTENAEVVKKGGGYQVRVRAGADVIHVIKTTVRSSVRLISGTKEQCERFCDDVNDENGEKLGVSVFGRPAINIVTENILNKSAALNGTVKQKIRRTLQKAVNEKKSNVVCFLI